MGRIEIVGNGDNLAAVNNWKRRNQFPQAIIIGGAQGSGRTTLAGYIAQAALCREQNPPCGSCSDCKRTAHGSHPDFLTITKENDGFKMDNIRALKTNAIVRPNEADYKVLLLKNAHEMSEGAQNALLKIIEEPPSFLIFIMTVSENKKMLDTISSRCVRLNTACVTAEQAVPYLKKQVRELTDFAATRAIQSSGGNIGRAIAMLTEQPTMAQELSEQLGRAIMMKDELYLMKICSSLEKDRQLYTRTLDMLQLILRDAIAIKSGSDVRISGTLNICGEIAQRVSTKRLCSLIESINQLIKYSDRYMNNTLLISLTSSRLSMNV